MIPEPNLVGGTVVMVAFTGLMIYLLLAFLELVADSDEDESEDPMV